MRNEWMDAQNQYDDDDDGEGDVGYISSNRASVIPITVKKAKPRKGKGGVSMGAVEESHGSQGRGKDKDMSGLSEEEQPALAMEASLKESSASPLAVQASLPKAAPIDRPSVTPVAAAVPIPIPAAAAIPAAVTARALMPSTARANGSLRLQLQDQPMPQSASSSLNSASESSTTLLSPSPSRPPQPTIHAHTAQATIVSHVAQQRREGELTNSHEPGGMDSTHAQTTSSMPQPSSHSPGQSMTLPSITAVPPAALPMPMPIAAATNMSQRMLLTHASMAASSVSTAAAASTAPQQPLYQPYTQSATTPSQRTISPMPVAAQPLPIATRPQFTMGQHMHPQAAMPYHSTAAAPVPHPSSAPTPVHAPVPAPAPAPAPASISVMDSVGESSLPTPILLLRHLPSCMTVSILGQQFVQFGRLVVKLLFTVQHGLTAILQFNSIEAAQTAMQLMKGRTYALEMTRQTEHGVESAHEQWCIQDLVYARTPLQLHYPPQLTARLIETARSQ